MFRFVLQVYSLIKEKTEDLYELFLSISVDVPSLFFLSFFGKLRIHIEKINNIKCSDMWKLK